MRDRGDMTPAAGIIIGLAVSIGGVAAIAAGVAWGEPVVRYAAWAALVIGESMR